MYSLDNWYIAVYSLVMSTNDILSKLPEGRMMTINEVAAVLNVTFPTLRRWDKNGTLRAFQPTAHTIRKYDPEDIKRFILRGGAPKTRVPFQGTQRQNVDKKDG